MFLLGVVSSFSAYFEQLLRFIMSLNNVNASVGHFREFEEFRSEWGGTGVSDEVMQRIRNEGVRLELKDISYTYPGNDKPTIEHLNLSVKAGEKLALISLNGAGKTTLVKLICGFYEPDEGELLLNDIPVRSFTREQYLSLMSISFQDDTLLPLTLDENILSKQEKMMDVSDFRKEQAALLSSGFLERYETLPGKGKSKLIKKINKDAVDFSGGEKQKLLFARTLCKEAPLMVLDEPTAALDPIAENEMYLNFAEVSKGKSVIYISHRLSSTRFCDSVYLLEGGCIVESGTHDELMQAGGRYSELYEMQSRYYKEQSEKERREKLMGDSARVPRDKSLRNGGKYENG